MGLFFKYLHIFFDLASLYATEQCVVLPLPLGNRPCRALQNNAGKPLGVGVGVGYRVGARLSPRASRGCTID